MRVASLITRLNIGGASPPVISLTLGLRERGAETLLVVGTPEPGEGTLEAEAAAAGVRVVQIPDLHRNPDPRGDLRALRALVALFREFKPDVVATHMSKAGALGRVAARMTGVPAIVHTYHGKGFDVFPRGWRRSGALWTERLLARVGTGNIVVSDKQRDEFLRLGVAPERKLRTIRYGIDLQPFLAAGGTTGTLRDELGLPQSRLLVGVVARLVAIKGQDVFLRAVARLRASHPEAEFLIVGDGAERGSYEALNRTTGAGAHFLGWRRDMPNVLASLDVVALPTVMDFEGTPVALIEALAARRAVVASDVGGVSEIIHEGQTGLIVPPRDVAGLAEGIARLLGSAADRARMGCAGQRLVCEQYGRDRMVEETDAYFRALLGDRSQ